MSEGRDQPRSDAPLVVSLDDLNGDEALRSIDLLGGKGANLAAMVSLGLPVPPGFVLTTALTQSLVAGSAPERLGQVLSEAVAALEKQTGRRFGDSADPLLVSVRSGAPVSMPGMLDTVLNVGANETTVHALSRRHGDAEFGFDTWCRFSRTYATVVLGIDAAEVSVGTGGLDGARHVQAVAAARGTPIPAGPFVQLQAAVAGVVASWDGDRARTYRRRERISADMGTAVVVQAMVYGNAGPHSGTGVVFSRDPSTGAKGACGDFLVRAQGEDVVGGAVATLPIQAMAELLPDAYSGLLHSLDVLERYHADLCDVEFTVEDGRLWLLQCRTGKRSAPAALRIAVEMAEDPSFPLDRAGAVKRVTSAQLQQLQQTTSIGVGAVALTAGRGASPGIAVGPLCSDPQRAGGLEPGIILVRPTTSPEDVSALVRAAAVVTTTGGLMSHAAVVARGWGIPAVTGASEVQVTGRGVMVGDRHVAEGTVVTVDGGTGLVYLGDQRTHSGAELPELARWQQWANEVGRLGFSPEAAESAEGAVASVSSLPLLRAVQLRGTVAVPVLATMLAASTEAVKAALQSSALLVEVTPAGIRLLDPGRRWLDEHLAAERAGADHHVVEEIYAAFAVLDPQLKVYVTSWQLRDVAGDVQPNDHSDAAYDAAVIGDLVQLYEVVRPLLDRLAVLVPRLGVLGPRLQQATSGLVAGDYSMVASPIKDSFHTIWFDVHEELLQLSGRRRQDLTEP